MEFKHTSVLLRETIENLDIKPEGIYVDRKADWHRPGRRGHCGSEKTPGTIQRAHHIDSG